jgi:predicted PP-loop superfamily ATPase
MEIYGLQIMAMGDNIMSKKKRKFKLYLGGADKMAHAVAIKGNSSATMHSANVRTVEFSSEDRLMTHLLECGKRLNERLGITDEHIDSTLKEIRKECWK